MIPGRIGGDGCPNACGGPWPHGADPFRSSGCSGQVRGQDLGTVAPADPTQDESEGILKRYTRPSFSSL